jgi:hypothetical protein
MKRSTEIIGILIALAALVIALLTWLLPFNPVGPSPVLPKESTQVSSTPTTAPRPTAILQQISPQPTGATATYTPQQPVNSYTVVVQAKVRRQDTEIFVNPQDSVNISYVSGQWSIWQGNSLDPSTDGNGQNGRRETCALMPQKNIGSLIGRVADNQPFFIGNGTAFRSSYSGNLSFSINDCANFQDNEGSLTIMVSVAP